MWVSCTYGMFEDHGQRGFASAPGSRIGGVGLRGPIRPPSRQQEAASAAQESPLKRLLGVTLALSLYVLFPRFSPSAPPEGSGHLVG